jgi:hypothetical protein
MKIIFDLSGLLVLPFWLLMILAPMWKVTLALMKSPWIVIGPVLVYAILVFPQIASILPTVMRPELSQIASLLATPEGATIAWMHFLAFDLFVGRWVYLESREKNFSPWLMAPILFLVLMLGPIGFLIYLILRSISRPVENRTFVQF